MGIDYQLPGSIHDKYFHKHQITPLEAMPSHSFLDVEGNPWFVEQTILQRIWPFESHPIQCHTFSIQWNKKG